MVKCMVDLQRAITRLAHFSGGFEEVLDTAEE